jgi:hypothetical protein
MTLEEFQQRFPSWADAMSEEAQLIVISGDGYADPDQVERWLKEFPTIESLREFNDEQLDQIEIKPDTLH